jgi:hypothetical protein
MAAADPSTSSVICHLTHSSQSQSIFEFSFYISFSNRKDIEKGTPVWKPHGVGRISMWDPHPLYHVKRLYVFECAMFVDPHFYLFPLACQH